MVGHLELRRASCASEHHGAVVTRAVGCHGWMPRLDALPYGGCTRVHACARATEATSGHPRSWMPRLDALPRQLHACARASAPPFCRAAHRGTCCAMVSEADAAVGCSLSTRVHASGMSRLKSGVVARVARHQKDTPLCAARLLRPWRRGTYWQSLRTVWMRELSPPRTYSEVSSRSGQSCLYQLVQRRNAAQQCEM